MEVRSLCIDLMPDKETHGQRDTHTDRQTQTDRMTIKLEIRKRTVHIKLQSQEKNSQEKNSQEKN